MIFITPSGECEFVNSYEKILLNKTPMGFFCPQTAISEDALFESIGPVAEELKFHGVFGYITIDFMMIVSTPGNAPRKSSHESSICKSSKHKLFFSGIKCYFDDFLAGEALFKTFMGNEYKQKSFLFIPYIENISFNKGLTYTRFFNDCKQNGVNYDVTRKVGSVFVPYDLIEKGIMGILLIGKFFVLKFQTTTFPVRLEELVEL